MAEASSKSTTAELKAKISNYEDQMAQVDELVAADPNNQSYLSLKADITKAIAYAQSLLKAEEAAKAAPAPAAPAAAAPAPKAAAEGGHSAATIPTGSGEERHGTRVGAHVELHWDQAESVGGTTSSWFPGEVIEFDGRAGPGGAVVRMIGYGALVAVATQDLRVVRPPRLPAPAEVIKAGASLFCKYAPDGRYHHARVDAIEQSTSGVPVEVKVEYTKLGKTEVVPAGYLSQQTAGQLAAATAAKSGTSTTHTTDGVRIPKYLQIADDDSEEEKQRKRRAVRSLQFKERVKRLHEDREHNKAAWQQFQTKGRRGAKRRSRFGATPAAPATAAGGGVVTAPQAKRQSRWSSATPASAAPTAQPAKATAAAEEELDNGTGMAALLMRGAR